MVTWAQGALDLCKSYTVDHLDELADFGTFESSHLSLVRADGAMDLYDGNLRAIGAAGEKLLDQVPPGRYLEHIREEVRPWSYMKFPFLSANMVEKANGRTPA